MITDAYYQEHMAAVAAEGFVFDPPGYERLTQWTHVLMHCVNAKFSFERLQNRPANLGDLDDALESHAFFIAGVMAYGRCYAQSGSGIPTLDAKQVYKGSTDGVEIHQRLITLRNTMAAHTDQSDLVRLTLAVREEGNRFVIRHLSTTALPLDELPNFLEAVEHTAHFVSVSLNKLLDHLGGALGKRLDLD